MLLLGLNLKAQNNIDSTSIYFTQNKYQKALNFASKNYEYDSLIEKGIFLFKNGDFINAISFFSTAYDLNENKNSEIEKITLLNIIGICYEEISDFEKAEYYYNKAISLNTIYSDEYFQPLNSLVQLYTETKDFSTAENQSILFLEEAKKHKGENSKEYLLAIRNLTLLYLSNDLFKMAEEFSLKEVQLNKKIFGNKSLEYLDSFSLYINLLTRKGKLIDAEKYSFDILKIYLNQNEKNYKQIALSYNQLATIQQNLFKYDLAKINFLKAINIIKKEYGELNPYHTLIASNLGVLHIVLEEYGDAEFYLKKSLEIKEKLQDTNVYTLYANLSVVYQKTGRCEDAEKYQLKSIENDQNRLSESYKLKIIGLALTYNCLKNTQKEFEYLLTTSDILKKKVSGIMTYMSNNEIQQYIHQYFHHRIYPLSFLIRNPIDFENLNISCFEEELMFRNLSIYNYHFVKKSVENSNDIALKIKYSKLIDNKRQIVKLNELPIFTRPKGYKNLILETENLEKYLVEQSNEFSKSKNTLSIKWDKLQGKLKSNEIVIDIVDFVYYDTKSKPDSTVYAAFVIGKDYDTPKFISLFERKQIEILLGRNNIKKDSTRINKQYTDKSISNLFLKSLEKELQGISTIYLTPSGLGHQIDFSALPISGNQTFGEKYKLHILSSPANIMDYKEVSLDENSNLELLLYGAIDYNKSNSIDNTENQVIEPNTIIADLSTRSGIKEYGYLNGTNIEVDQIEFKAIQKGFKTIVLKERKATEESINQLDGKTTPFVLHLATHGFFFPAPEKELPKDFPLEEGKSKIYKASDNPMMRSGLIFAGANKYWGKSFEKLTAEDGILTASEISNLDLSACQLVVLSACETGLGEIKGSEGVFGLQRAFKMAGAKNIIMSLWKVPDAQTAELFDIFYEECFAGKSIHEAFGAAQSKMKAKYSPYYWAGFVLLE